MKKLLLVLAVVMFASVARADGFGFCLGPKVGYQTTKLSLDKAEISDGFSNHLTVGVFGRINLGSFIIQPELLWFKSGQVFNVSADPSISMSQGININPTVTLSQQNMAFPIFLGYQLGSGPVNVRANVGPVMYFVLSQKKTIDADGSAVSVDFNNLDAKSMTWGAALNFGIDVLFLSLDVCYSFGLSEYFKNDTVNWSIGGESGTFVIDKTKQNMFTVTLGLKLL